jgi:hypothetical protein
VAIKAAAEMWAKEFQSLKPRSFACEYNCVGLVFGSRRTAIEPSDLQKILDDDGYVQVLERDAVCGDIVLYKDNKGEYAHVALVVEHKPKVDPNKPAFETFVVSQWGDTGEYIHLASDVPPTWLGRPIEFWSERIK